MGKPDVLYEWFTRDELLSAKAGFCEHLTLQGTGSVSDVKIFEIQVLSDAQFSVFTELNKHASDAGMTSITIPAGTVIEGAITALTLTSGNIRCSLVP